MLSTLAVVFLTIFPFSRAAPTLGHTIHPVVTLPSRSKVIGRIDADSRSVRQFLGIPYAQPPVGQLRWEAPLSNVLPSVLNATTLGISCPQPHFIPPTIFSEEVPEYNPGDINSTSEDCLTLSIWTPQRAKNLPVIIHFYGGGWYTGGQNVPYQIPTQWVQRTKDLIVVVLNFRGNIFGFPNARGAKRQNLGLLDQRLAVEWIHANIASFGGDPNKITLWGFSSGAEAVDMYSFAWHEDPIVKGLIMGSGNALIEDGSGPKYSNFSYVAKMAGCGDQDAEEELECLKKVDASTLTKIIADDYNGGASVGLGFGSAADELTVFSNYSDRLAEGKVAKLPAIIGVNKEDGNAFAPYNASGADQAISDYWFLNLFLCTSYRTAKLRVAAGIPTYRYLYAGNFSNVSPRPWMGAYHGSDLPMLFGTHGNYRGASTEYQKSVSEMMQDSWRAFADDPQHGLGRHNWDPFTSENNVVRWFGDNGLVARNGIGDLKLFEDQC